MAKVLREDPWYCRWLLQAAKAIMVGRGWSCLLQYRTSKMERERESERQSERERERERE